MGAGDLGDPLQVGLLGGLGGITGHPTFAEQVVSARRTKPVNPNRLVPPHPAAWATFNAWAAFNAAAAHAIEGKIKPGLPRHSEFCCSLWQLRFPPASGGGLLGMRREGGLFALPPFFPKPGSLIWSVFGCAAVTTEPSRGAVGTAGSPHPPDCRAGFVRDCCF